LNTLPPEVDRRIAVLSDIEMGAGGPTDDFPSTVWLAEHLRAFATHRTPTCAVELVFNGDTFDLLKTSTHAGLYPRHITASVALEKLERVLMVHAPIIEALRDALEAGCGVHFVVGNHDLELVFPEVQQRLREAIGDSVCFPGFSTSFGDVYIEHGSQDDPLFRVDPDRLFVDVQGEQVLCQPWGAVALLDVALPLQRALYHFDRLKPRERVLELLPELRELLLDAYWSYWTREYVTDWFSGSDPLKTMDWSVFREIVYRFATDDADVAIGGDWIRRMHTDKRHRVFLLGHEHRARQESWGNRKVLRSGAVRQEFMVEDDGVRQIPMPKIWIEVAQVGDRTVHSQLVEHVCPPVPPGYAPTTIYDTLSDVRQARAQVESQRAAREAHERHIVWPWSRR